MVCLLLMGVTGHAVAKDDYPYQQSYSILIGNETAGTETVVEKKDGSGKVISTSEHDIMVTDGMAMNRMQFSTRMVFPKNSLIPETYVNQYKTDTAGDAYDVSVAGGRITRVLNRNGQSTTTEAALTPNMVIVDFNVYHQYEYLVRRYDRKKGGVQAFADFIPVIGNDIPLKVTFLSEETRQFDQKNIKVRNFRVEFVGIQTVTLAIDENDRLVSLDNPAQDLKVIRKDLF
ncbi:MAG: hypothetical protein LBP68_05810 [Acidobacteriota bacterium]|nr:hypothetical protein [Acidobacteriota bacterium]